VEKALRSRVRFVLAGIAISGLSVIGCGGGGKATGTGGKGGSGTADGGATGGKGGSTDAPVNLDGGLPDSVSTDASTTIRLALSPAAVMVTEGAMAPGVFSVSLTQPFSQPITVTVISANPNVATVFPETVTFGAMKTGPEMVQVIAPVDDDTVDNSTTLVVSSPETGPAFVTVNVDDPDVQGLLVTPNRVSMTEGRTEGLNVRLAKKPASSVVVTLTSSNMSKLTVGTSSLTFTTSNYATPQTVMLTGVQDDDANLENVNVNITATGNIQAVNVPVEITDDDAVNLDVTPPSLMLTEKDPAKKAGSFNVALTLRPSGNVTVAVTSSNATKVTVAPASLTFTPDNFMTAQAVTATALDDDDARAEVATITFTASGITPAPQPRTTSVTVDDPDNLAVQATPSTVSLNEGASGTFNVRLSLPPEGDTTVNVFSQNPGKVEVLPPVLHFNAANFNVTQPVTVRSLQDDDLADDSVKVTLATSGADNVNVTVAIKDDDPQSIQLIPAVPGNPLVMQEMRAGGPASTSQLGVRLAFRPSGDTTVRVMSSNGKVTVLPAFMTFSPSNYSIPQFTTLTAPHDNDMVDDTATITASAENIPDATLDVQIRDVDSQNFDVSAQTVGPMTEGTSVTFTVKLTIDPPSPVTVNFTSSRASKISVSPASCMLASMTSVCTATVKGEQDNDGQNETATISIVDAAGKIASRTVVATVTDDDIQTLMVSPTSVSITEGMTTTFTVRLALDPVSPATISVFSQSPAKLEISPPVLSFNSGNFDMPQTVTIKALEDDDLVSETPASTPPSRVTVAGQSVGAPNVEVLVNETDNDTQAIVLTPATTMPSPLVMQEGSTNQIGVRLAFRPAADVTVTLGSSDSTKLKVEGGTSTMLTFSPSTFSTPQFVTITAPHDTDMVDDNVTVAATASGIATSTEFVRLTDIDVLAFDISTTALGVIAEGSSGSFVVKLTVAPASPVNPALTSSNGAITATFASACSLTAANFASGCTVLVAAVDDNNALDESATITVSDPAASDPDHMRPIPSRSVTASSDDNDTQAIVLTDAQNPEILRGRRHPVVRGHARVRPRQRDVGVHVHAVPGERGHRHHGAQSLHPDERELPDGLHGQRDGSAGSGSRDRELLDPCFGPWPGGVGRIREHQEDGRRPAAGAGPESAAVRERGRTAGSEQPSAGRLGDHAVRRRRRSCQGVLRQSRLRARRDQPDRHSHACPQRQDRRFSDDVDVQQHQLLRLTGGHGHGAVGRRHCERNGHRFGIRRSTGDPEGRDSDGRRQRPDAHRHCHCPRRCGLQPARHF